MKKIVVFCLFFISLTYVTAQNTDDFKNFNPQNSFDAFQQNMEKQLSDFQDSINHRFAKELERQWVEYQRFEGKERQRKPKPSVLPVAPQQHDRSSDELPAEEEREPTVSPSKPSTPFEPEVPTEPVAPSEPVLPKEPSTPIEPIPSSSDQPNLPTPAAAEEDASVNQLSATSYMQLQPVSFYTQLLPCACPRQWTEIQLMDLSEKSVSAFWSSLAKENYEDFIDYCRVQQQKMQLNDWGVFELVKNIARQIFYQQYDEQTVFTVFVLNQLGYDARMGRVGKQLALLLPSTCQMFSVSYLTQGSTLYYIFSLYPKPEEKGSIFTYSEKFLKAKNALDLNIYHPLRFTSQKNAQDFTTKLYGETITIPTSQSIIDFYENYPQVELSVYANACPEAQWAKNIAEALNPILEDKSEYEKVAALLSFLHKSFPYKTDNDQFGYEKCFFCEENFYYPSNDCEDRSVLFSYLVRQLVGLEVILLDYPDHIATAVHFNNDSVKGDYYLYHGKKYIVCDPTYIGASIGEAMPQYKNMKASIIGLKK